ncbi:hypothetical protein [Candidatus Vidania fulgoroideorum]
MHKEIKKIILKKRIIDCTFGLGGYFLFKKKYYFLEIDRKYFFSLKERGFNKNNIEIFKIFKNFNYVIYDLGKSTNQIFNKKIFFSNFNILKSFYNLNEKGKIILLCYNYFELKIINFFKKNFNIFFKFKKIYPSKIEILKNKCSKTSFIFLIKKK